MRPVAFVVLDILLAASTSNGVNRWTLWVPRMSSGCPEQDISRNGLETSLGPPLSESSRSLCLSLRDSDVRPFK